MRIFLFIIFTFIIFSSCAEKKSEQKVVEIYSPADFFKKIKIVDTLCINEKKRAKTDIQNGKILLNYSEFYNRPGFTPKRYFSGEGEEFVYNELAKLNIGIDTTLIPYSSIRGITDYIFSYNCYQKVMADKVHSILNSHAMSLDSLIKKAEKHYVMNHPDRIYPLDERDIGYKSGNRAFEDFDTKSRMVFGEKFQYPDNYKFKKEKSVSYTTADFILMKNGEIKKLKVEATFKNPENLKYKSYFENELKKFILNTKWVHPKSSGLFVNSEMHFIVWHK